MKKILFIAAILLSTSALFAQQDTTFYKREVRISVVPLNLASVGLFREMYYSNLSVSYLYRPVKWFWVGGNFINYFGEKKMYDWREYYPDNSFKDFETSKMKFCTAIAPEIRLSYINKPSSIVYIAVSVGVGYEDGMNNRWYEYPRLFTYIQLTFLGFSCNFGEKQNGFWGGEIGYGHKGVLSIHGGYRF